MIKGNNGVTDCFIGGVYARRMNGGKLIVDGSVQSNHVDTGSFSASGLALFGGNIQSSNFSTGSAGWKINNSGDAEFNSLIVRSSLVDGSVSDGVSTVSLSPQYTPNASILMLTTLPGAIATYDAVYTVGLYFEHRVAGLRTSDGSAISTAYVLEERIQFAGSWSSWVTVYNSGYAPATFGMSLGETYTQKSFVGNRIYNATSVEWRLKTFHSASPVNTTQNCFRNATFSLKAVKR